MDILSKFDPSRRVLVVGELAIEKHIHGKYDTATADGMPVFSVQREESHLTGTGTIIKNLTAMGLAVDHISVVGNNEASIFDLMKQSNIDATGIITSQSFTVKTSIRYFSNERQCFWTADTRGSGKFHESGALQALISEKLKANTYNMLIISDSNQCIMSDSVIHNVLFEADRFGIPTMVNIDTVKNDGLFCSVSYIKLLFRETNMEISSMCKQVFDHLNAKTAIFGLFEQGLACYSSDGLKVIPIQGYKHLADLHRADDTLLAAIVFGIVHNFSLNETCNFACISVKDIIHKAPLETFSMMDVIEQNVIRTRKELKNLKHFIPSDATVVMTTGCFDMIHTGHVESLRHAKELGNILIIALNSDISVKSYKGESRPIIPLEQRCRMLQATKYVDFIVIFDEQTPTWIVETIQPDIFVKGAEYTEERLRNTFPSLKKVYLTPQITSTTTIIAKIKNI